MTIYLQTARQFAENPNQWAMLRKEAVFFSSKGWQGFKAYLLDSCPDMDWLLSRVAGPSIALPVHPSYRINDEPLHLLWTADDCRLLFRKMVQASNQATELAYDFWELLALICCGINEEGICAY